MRTFYLDEEIFFSKTINATENLTGKYTIYRYIKDDVDGGEGHSGGFGDELFQGSIFIADGQKTVDIFLNDILESTKTVNNSIVAKNNQMIGNGDINIANNYNIYRIFLDLETLNGDRVASFYEDFQVFLVYRYPLLTSNTLITNLPDSDSDGKHNTLLREGFDSYTNESVLMPHIVEGMVYPTYINQSYDFLVDTQTVAFNLQSIPNKRYEPLYASVRIPDTTDDFLTLESVKTVISEAVMADSIIYEQDADNYLFHTELWTEEEIDEKIEQLKRGESVVVYYGDDEEKIRDMYIEAVNTFGDAVVETAEIPIRADIKVAKIDKCPSRYYLMWYDRFGGVQSQPFSLDKECIFSESFATRQNKDQFNRRRLLNPKATPKWKLVSDAIKDAAYPIYESLFTSPYVTLIDTVTNKAHNVIVTDTNYQEKNYVNQKKHLVNFTVNVELNKVQNIIY